MVPTLPEALETARPRPVGTHGHCDATAQIRSELKDKEDGKFFHIARFRIIRMEFTAAATFMTVGGFGSHCGCWQ